MDCTHVNRAKLFHIKTYSLNLQMFFKKNKNKKHSLLIFINYETAKKFQLNDVIFEKVFKYIKIYCKRRMVEKALMVSTLWTMTFVVVWHVLRMEHCLRKQTRFIELELLTFIFLRFASC